LPGLIQSVHLALAGVSAGQEAPEVAPKEPAVPVRRSITPDYLICLEDGRKFKSLKRHLRTKYNMSPEEYRAKWNLPKDYPMVAPNYAKARSDLAKQMGLGQGGRQAPRKKR
jgi:predicted transcriptional regulator